MYSGCRGSLMISHLNRESHAQATGHWTLVESAGYALHRSLTVAIASGIAALVVICLGVVAVSTGAAPANAGAAIQASAGSNGSSPGAPAPAPTCGPGSNYIIEQTQG